MATQANKQRSGKKKANKTTNWRSGGEENKRQMANNVNARDEFMMGTW